MTDRRRSTNIVTMIVAAFAVVLVLKLAQPVILTLLLAIVLAYIMDPLMMLLRRTIGLPLWIAILTTAILFLGVFAGVGTIAYFNFVSFAGAFPTYQEALIERLNTFVEQVGSRVPYQLQFDPMDELRALPIGAVLLRMARSLLSGAMQFLVIYLFGVLFLIEKYFLPRKLVRVFRSDTGSRMPVILRHIDASLRMYIGVKTLISLAVAVLSTVALIAFGVEFAVVWGMITFLLNFIPSVGSIASTLLPFIFSFVQYSGTPTPYYILMVLGGLQFTTGNILEPYFMGDSLNLSLFVVFLSLFFWGWLWGPPGILLAVPMTTSVRIVLRNIPATERFAHLFDKAQKDGSNPRRRRRK